MLGRSGGDGPAAFIVKDQDGTRPGRWVGVVLGGGLRHDHVGTDRKGDGKRGLRQACDLRPSAG